MSFIFEFGNRSHPIGKLDKNIWERLKPNWKQIRTVNVAEVKTPNEECGEVDALWTRVSGIPIAVTTADCVPILLYRKDSAAVAAVHAGWQGTLQRIVPKFFEALPSELCVPSEWIAKLGPSIRACCYEFGDDLIAKFKEEFPNLTPEQLTPKPRHLDLIAILSSELHALSVEIESVEDACTFCKKDSEGKAVCFSYRQGDRNSRQYSIIMK
jgi:YfiH family protein